MLGTLVYELTNKAIDGFNRFSERVNTKKGSVTKPNGQRGDRRMPVRAVTLVQNNYYISNSTVIVQNKFQ